MINETRFDPFTKTLQYVAICKSCKNDDFRIFLYLCLRAKIRKMCIPYKTPALLYKSGV